MADFNLGTVTAYGYAKDKGYTGTEDEFAELMASYAQVAEDAAESAEQAAQSATTATTKAGEAATSATNAANANTAAQAAKTGAETAAQTATTKADEASGSAATATTKAAESATSATNAAQSATTATTKAGEATTSATNAAASASAAAGSAQTAQDVADSIPADYTQLSDDVSSLKEDLTDNGIEDIPLIKEKLTLVKSANIFNKDDAISGRLDASGAVYPYDNGMTSDFIPVSAGDVIKTYYVPNNVYAANMTDICGYDASKSFVSGSNSKYVNTYTVPDGVAFIRFSVGTGIAETFMLIVNGAQPSAFIPYENYYIASKAFVDEAIRTYGFATLPIKKEDTDFWTAERSQNLFDKDNVVNGEYFNTNGSVGTASNCFREHVELNGAGVYSFYVMGNFFGLANAVKIPTFNKDMVFVKTLTGTTTETTATNKNLMLLTVTEQDISDGVYYIGYSEHPDNIDTLMVVKGDDYPSTYIPYYRRYYLPDLSLRAENAGALSSNPLFGKTAIFDGDSICEGANSAMGNYGNGWASRIGVDNSMIYHNTGVGGGTITAGLYFDNNTARPRHWLCTYIDTIHANYPDLDYLILEGGTNDADNLIGNTEKIGEIDETDYNRDNEANHFDDETYCGALDTLFYKVQQYYPKKKVGFIVAQKMGRALNADGNPDPYIANRRHFFDLAIQACKKWGIPYIDLWHDGYLNPNSTAMYDPQYNTSQSATEHGLCYVDGQHLTAYGYDVISPKIAEWMKTL